jgi:raffinose/stachyose/melibiose transport system permease protein
MGGQPHARYAAPEPGRLMVRPGGPSGTAVTSVADQSSAPAVDVEPLGRGRRWHIAVFLAPAVLVYTVFMIVPLADTLWLSLFQASNGVTSFVGLENFRLLFFDERWSAHFWPALGNNFYFFIIHMCVQNPIGVALAAMLSMPKVRGRAFYRTVFFLPTMLSFVIVGFVWKLILSPIWGIAPMIFNAVGLHGWFKPWLGLESSALTTLSLISVWQYVGIPMMLIYAALLSIPDEVIEAAELDGITGLAQFWKIKLPLILPTIGICSILTFVGNFNAFDLIYTVQGALAGPNFSTDILGTFLYRTFFGNQLQLGDPNMGATIATMMFFIILGGVLTYLFAIQRRLRRYQF